VGPRARSRPYSTRPPTPDPCITPASSIACSCRSVPTGPARHRVYATASTEAPAAHCGVNPSGTTMATRWPTLVPAQRGAPFALGLSLAEQGIDVRQLLEPGERPRVHDLLGGLEESAPRSPGEGAAHTDSSNSESRRLRDRDERSIDQKVHRFGRHRGDDHRDLPGGSDPWSVETVGASLSVGPQPSNRLVDIPRPHREAPGSTGQHDARSPFVDRLACGPDTLHGHIEVMERARLVARGI